MMLANILLALAVPVSGSVRLECEAFEDCGGWKNDTQFMDQMGSPYLIAHGLGKPVANAATPFEVSRPGTYRVFARTMNWTARWSDSPAGTFRIVVDGTELPSDLGTGGPEWRWQKAGELSLDAGVHRIELRDLTGFDGRCDAICLTQGDVPVEGPRAVPSDEETRTCDLAVVGGGIAGICTAVSAARLGLSVALVNDRPVLGGNNSSEVRVHLGAWQNMPPYPRLGDVLAEFGPRRGGNAEPAGTYEDGRKLDIVRAETNIALVLNCRVTGVETNAAGAIASVSGVDTRTGGRQRFRARWFADCTGDGTVGCLAGADFRMGREAKGETGEPWAPEKPDMLTMGASVQWRAHRVGSATEFPIRPWMFRFDDTNGRAEMKGDWDWEAGLGRDQIAEAERIRDYGLLVAYSNWAYVKNVSSRREEFRDAELEWVAYIAGRRESRRLMGDFILTERHVQERDWQSDGTCVATWTIDLHFPKTKEQTNFAGEPFRANSENERTWPYSIPYRCYYSRNVPNLFMAGRDISVTHIALGTTRLMRTHGMMGEVVGMAASLCKRHGCNPRDIYLRHLEELKALMRKGVGDGRSHPPQMYNIQTSLDPRFRDRAKGNFQVKDEVPALLKTSAGADVTSVAAWEKTRRPEILKTMTEEVYGVRPVGRPADLKFEVLKETSDFGGKATKKLVRGTYSGPGGQGELVFAAWLPRGRAKAPAFMHLSPRPAETAADPKGPRPIYLLPAEYIVGRGYAAIAVCDYDTTPDWDRSPAVATNGAFRAFGPSAIDGRTDCEWGILSAWAWGASRVMDWIETEPAIDASRVGVVGLSRNGKTALVAGATDQRFALTVSCCSGMCGAKLNHLDCAGSEDAGAILIAHRWFSPRFRQWRGRDREMPFDQHWLLALVAPRLLFVSSATKDDWAGPRGEFMSCRLASPAWELYGEKGLVGDGFPRPDNPLSEGSVGYHLRSGAHSITLEDWRAYLDFADRHGWSQAGGQEKPTGACGLAFYDIVPFAPGREARTAQDIRAVHGRTGLDTFLYSVSLDPRGYPAFDNVKRATESFRRLKAELGDTPVKLGFLLQSILGHWPRVDREIEPWQRSVNEDGEIKRFCIRDERYQDYIRRTAAALAAERPCFILGDDDIRAFSPRLECFCPLHTAEFNRRAGTSFTPERYRAAVKACREGDAVATVCAQLRDEIPMTAAKLIREGIDSVDPTIPAGACMPGAEQLLAGPRAKVLAGKGNPVTLRLANGQYSEIDRKDLTGYVLKTQAFIDLYRGSVDRILDESDTFPHTLYARSGRSFGAKLALGIFSGIRGAKLWFVGMHKGGERVPEAHDRALGENMPRFAEMARALDGSTPLGVRVPAFRKVPPLRAGGPDFFAASVWPNALLGVYGIPFFADFSRMPGEVVLLGGGATVDRLTDAELDELFRGKVLADGPAALRLAARGHAKELGCRPVSDGRAFNIEAVCATREHPPFSKSPNTPALTDVADGAAVYSELLYSPIGAADPAAERVAAAAVCRTNSAGGVTFTASFDAQTAYTAQNLRRKAWVVGALRSLDPAFAVVCENAEPNLTQARRGKDGRTYAITLNVSYDDIAELRYSAARSMEGAEILGADGKWRPANAKSSDGVWTLPQRLACMEFALVRW